MPLLEVSCSLMGWLGLYFLFRRTFIQREAEWSCRLVTLTHGVVIVVLTAYVIFIDGPWPLTHAGTENTELQVRVLSVCLGYFLFDLGWCTLHGGEGPVMLLHHGASVAGLLLALLSGVSACETCGVVFGSEVTNPLLQLRWFLRRLGRHRGALADAVDLLFVLLFAGLRVGVGAAMLYCELTSPRTTAAMKLGGVLMYGLAWVFMVDIARFGYRKCRAKYRKWTDGERHQQQD